MRHLVEFDRAVKPSYVNSSAEDVKQRHKEFVIAIEIQISKIESSLHKSSVSNGKPPRPWVHLDEGERDELALFLSGPATDVNKTFAKMNIETEESANLLEPHKQSTQDSRKCPLHSPKVKEDKLTGHRRTASAGAEIDSWNIPVGDDVFPLGSFDENCEPLPRKIPSLSGFLNKMDTTSMLKWSSNGYRKMKTKDHLQEADNSLSQSQEFTMGLKDFFRRSKSCLDGCDDSYNNKQLHDWYGSIQRLLQRSQYQLQYSQPFQVVIWIFLLVFSIGLFVTHAT